MNSPCRYAEDITARSIAAAMKRHGGEAPGLIRPSTPERFGWQAIRFSRPTKGLPNPRPSISAHSAPCNTLHPARQMWGWAWNTKRLRTQ